MERQFTIFSIIATIIFSLYLFGCTSTDVANAEDTGSKTAGDTGTKDAGAKDSGEEGEKEDGGSEGETDAETEDTSGGGGSGIACASDRDCGDGFMCNEGSCVACVTDDNCPEGFSCINNICSSGTSTTSCASDRDCPQDAGIPYCDLTLKGGTCVQCITSAHCTAGLSCVNGQCTSAPTTQCTKTSDCPLGNICDTEKGVCVTGCNRNEDCPEGAKCNRSVSPNGACVQCLADEDCSEGTRCINSVCSNACLSDADCAEAEHCDTSTGDCVACLETSHCPKEYVCRNNACIPGCESDDDCLVGKKCENGLCGGGCSDDRDCSEGMKCELTTGICRSPCTQVLDCWGVISCPSNGKCYDGSNCNATYTCPREDICDTDTLLCYDCVVDQSSAVKGCNAGQQCINNLCTGCRDNADCPTNQVCDTSTSQCVECLAHSDCKNPPLSLCDPQRHSCVECLGDPDCQSGKCVERVCVDCDADSDCQSGVCVNQSCAECRADTDCTNGEKCDVATHSCVSASVGGSCDVCSANTDCMSNMDCVTRKVDAAEEKVCLLKCTDDNGCPAAYKCIQDSSGKHCAPAYGWDNNGNNSQYDNRDFEPFSSCVAVRDTISGKQCSNSGTSECGLISPAVDDASCYKSGTTGVCTYKCADGLFGLGEIACPEGFTCKQVQSGGQPWEPGTSVCVKGS